MKKGYVSKHLTLEKQMKSSQLFAVSCLPLLTAHVFLSTILTCTTVAFAAHPLITDDAGTIGKGGYQLELNGEYGYDKEDGVIAKTTEGAASLSYGLSESVDLVAGVPYQHIKTTEDDAGTTDNGFSDTSLEMKWRFYEHEDVSLAIKPGLSLPTGDDEDGLGTGKVTYSLFTILSKEMDPWAFHLNLGYIRNENTVDEEKDIWHVSIASCFAMTENLTAVANIGAESNTDEFAGTDPAFILAGLIYALSDEFDFDCGFKFGINDVETDTTVLAGMTWKF